MVCTQNIGGRHFRLEPSNWLGLDCFRISFSFYFTYFVDIFQRFLGYVLPMSCTAQSKQFSATINGPITFFRIYYLEKFLFCSILWIIFLGQGKISDWCPHPWYHSCIISFYGTIVVRSSLLFNSNRHQILRDIQ